MKSVLIRVDASGEIGFGHLMRMIALGQLLQDQGVEPHYASIPYLSAVQPMLEREGFVVHLLPACHPWTAQADATELGELARALRPSWLILDGYKFDTEYQRATVQAGPAKSKLFCIDDLAACHFVSDLVLNQNYGSEGFAYSTEPSTRKLLGLRYALLRREFRKLDLSGKRHPPRPRNILITLGGSSAASAALATRVIQGIALTGLKDLRIRVLSGAPLPQPSVPFDLEVRAKSDRMAEELAWADIAITAGGSTMWELLYCRVPFLAIALNTPQEDYLRFLESEEICVSLGRSEILTPQGVYKSFEAFLEDPQKRSAILAKTHDWIDPRRTARELLAAMEL